MLRYLMLCVLALPLLAQEAVTPVWNGDFDAAVVKAKAEKKLLLVDFTGSDWCGWCKKLDAEVFGEAAFLKDAQAKYILVALDFPQAEEIKAKVPNPARNQELQQKYGVQGFPTILVVDVEGTVLAQTGYQPGGPEAYTKHLDELVTKGRAAIAESAVLLKAVADAKPEGKAAALTKVLDALEKLPVDSPAGDGMRKCAKEALTLDADNKLGLKLRTVKALLKSGDKDAAIADAARALDPKNENGLLEVLVAQIAGSVDSEEALKAAIKAIEDLDALGTVKDAEIALQLFANAAFWNKQFLQDMEKAKKFAAKALPFAKDNERAKEMLQGILDEK